MDDTSRQLDEALEKLLDGEELSQLQRQYPAYASELASYVLLRDELNAVAKLTPSEDSLRRALASARVADATSQETTYASRFVWFFSTYKTALVLPVLVVMLIATGTLVSPQSEPSNEAVPMSLERAAPEDAAIYEARVASDAPRSVAQGDAISGSSMLMKAPQSAAPTPMPEDQELASVFAEEMNYDKAAAQSAESEAVASLNDHESLSGYENTYDAQTL